MNGQARACACSLLPLALRPPAIQGRPKSSIKPQHSEVAQLKSITEMTDDVFHKKSDRNKYALLLQEELFITKAELDFLRQREEMDKNKQRYIRYKLRRKIKHFYDSELPLLVEQGYIIAGNVAANSCGVAAGSHASRSHLPIGKAEQFVIAEVCKLM